MRRLLIACAAGLALALFVGLATVQAELPPDQVARLGNDLTPLGAEKAGNADGTIPAWTGGITTPPQGYTPGAHHPDPFADDEVLFTITGANMDQHADKLTPGHRAMLETYGTFKMKVYPTRRSASCPQRIYDMTKKVAATAELVEREYEVEGDLRRQVAQNIQRLREFAPEHVRVVGTNTLRRAQNLDSFRPELEAALDADDQDTAEEMEALAHHYQNVRPCRLPRFGLEHGVSGTN